MLPSMGNPSLRPSHQVRERSSPGTPMRLIVCGGRDFIDRERAFRALDAAHAKRPIGVVIHGGARGGDTLAGAWAEARGIPVEVYPADWKGLGPAAGPKRNQQMADAGADGCLALPGGAGTEDMCERARDAGIPVWRPFGY